MTPIAVNYPSKQKLTLVEPPWNNPEIAPLAVLHLNNWLNMTHYLTPYLSLNYGRILNFYRIAIQVESFAEDWLADKKIIA